MNNRSNKYNRTYLCYDTILTNVSVKTYNLCSLTVIEVSCLSLRIRFTCKLAWKNKISSSKMLPPFSPKFQLLPHMFWNWMRRSIETIEKGRKESGNKKGKAMAEWRKTYQYGREGNAPRSSRGGVMKCSLHPVFYVLLGCSLPRVRLSSPCIRVKWLWISVSNCGRLKQPTNLSAIFHRPPDDRAFFRPPSLLVFSNPSVYRVPPRDVPPSSRGFARQKESAK